MTRKVPTLCTVAVLLLAAASASAVKIKSPDGQVAAKLTLTPAGAPQWSVIDRGTVVLADSPLGLTLVDGEKLDHALKITGVEQADHDETWKPVCGQWSTVRNHYREATVHLERTAPPNRKFSVTLRAYDEGVALRYTIPKQPDLAEGRIASEKTGFVFTADHPAWATYFAQGIYAKVPLSHVKRGCERPLVVKVADDCYAALCEADLVDGARMKFEPLAGVPHALVTRVEGQQVGPLPMTTAWRLVMLGRTPGQLLDRSYMVKNLCEPCAIPDTSWIKPGTMIRDITLSTAGGKACVDFAAKHHLAYVLYDAGWYGPERKPTSNASRPLPAPHHVPFDLHEVIAYGKAHGVGIVLYVNHIALERQIDQILPLYEKWGVAGVKYGFVNVGPQKWTSWLHEAVRKAAAHHLVVDVHDEYRPTGYSRTYPNFLTQEGIRGDEATPSAQQTLTIAFTRMLAGAADSTFCYYNPRVDKIANHAYQLAKSVVLYSPLQSLFWYDRPGTSGQQHHGMDGQIGDESELAFWDALPTAWNETRTLEGAIGEYAVVARRSGDDWYIGAMNAGTPHTFTVKLDMLPVGRRYTATIYRNDPNAPTRTHVGIEHAAVDHDSTLTIHLDARDGEAIRLSPATN